MADRILAHIHFLHGEMGEAFILKKRETGFDWNGQYIAYCNNTICTAIFNPFVCQFYVDDKYGVIPPDRYIAEGITEEDLTYLAEVTKANEKIQA